MLGVPSLDQLRRQDPADAADGGDQDHRQHEIGLAHGASRVQDDHREHGREAEGDRAHPEGVRHVQRRGADEPLVARVVDGRADQRHQHRRDRHQRERMDELARPGRQHLHEQVQPQVLVAVHGNRRSSMQEPDERDRDDLVRPDDGLAEDVARDHAHQQQHRDVEHQRRRDGLERLHPDTGAAMTRASPSRTSPAPGKPGGAAAEAATPAGLGHELFSRNEARQPSLPV